MTATPYLPLPGSHPLWVAHLTAFGFARHTDVCAWHWCDTGEWREGCRTVMVTPSGHETWVVATNDGTLPSEVATVGELRRYFNRIGLEPWF